MKDAKNYRLTHAQIERLARQAKKHFSYAQTMAGCLPDELGCTVAEDFAESAIEEAAKALTLIARIKCALRIERIEGRIKNVLNQLAPHEVDALVALSKSGRIHDRAHARALRSIHGRFPKLLHVGPLPADPNSTKVPLGGFLKNRGIELVRFVNGGAS